MQYKMLKMGWFGCSKGTLMITGSSTIQQSAYKFLLSFHSNDVLSCTVSEIWREIG